jgi:hypothetical protein
LTHHTEKANT